MSTNKTRNSSTTSFSFSRRYFTPKTKHPDEIPAVHQSHVKSQPSKLRTTTTTTTTTPRKNLSITALSKLKSAVARTRLSSGLAPRLVGTLFGHRRHGHVHLAFQEDPRQVPAILVHLPTPTSLLVREMASGVVRIALECQKKTIGEDGTRWMAYCNGNKCGYAAVRRKEECFGGEEWKVLEAIGRVTTGAGVVPSPTGARNGEEVMYMRGKFERVVGKRDCEAFYMMNPDGGFLGGHELSVYFLRV